MTANATEVVVTLGGAKKAVQLYPPAHPAYGEAMDALVGAVHVATVEGPFALNWHQGRLYDGSVVIPEDLHGVESVAVTLEERGIESLTFSSEFARADALGLIDVLALKPEEGLDVESELMSRGVQGVSVAFLAKGDEGEDDAFSRSRKQDRALHARLTSTSGTLSEQLAAGTSADLSATSSAVASLLGRLKADPSSIIALATIRSDATTMASHASAVMIYTSALGQGLKLPDEAMERLATAALLHDVGKAAFDLNDPIQAEACRSLHPRVGAEELQQLVLDDPSPMLVAYEHHMGADGSGFPERPADYVPHPYSRMVAVADHYENLIHPDDGSDGITPDKAILGVLREAGKKLDPFFARAFAQVLGVFPIGCVVRLSDQTVGVVARTSDDPLAPVVRLAFDERGFEFSEPPEIELAAGYVRIVEVMSANALDLEVSEIL
jgi:HD-GYP domain-containing protein (c-di-GMP phosphodiesterase class II)